MAEVGHWHSGPSLSAKDSVTSRTEQHDEEDVEEVCATLDEV